MDNIQTLTEMVSPLDMAEKLLEAVRDMEAQMALQRQRINELEQEMTALKNDPWTSRVTYENVVEMIALNEDSAVRDEMRKVFEPLLKKAQVQQLRRDIKCKVKELDGDEGAKIMIDKADVKVLSPGNTIAHTINERRLSDYGRRE